MSLYAASDSDGADFPIRFSRAPTQRLHASKVRQQRCSLFMLRHDADTNRSQTNPSTTTTYVTLHATVLLLREPDVLLNSSAGILRAVDHCAPLAVQRAAGDLKEQTTPGPNPSLVLGTHDDKNTIPRYCREITIQYNTQTIRYVWWCVLTLLTTKRERQQCAPSAIAVAPWNVITSATRRGRTDRQTRGHKDTHAAVSARA